MIPTVPCSRCREDAIGTIATACRYGHITDWRICKNCANHYFNDTTMICRYDDLCFFGIRLWGVLMDDEDAWVTNF